MASRGYSDGQSRDLVVLKGLGFFARHGVLQEERALGQKFVVDLELGCCLEKAGRTDDVASTVDYAAVYRAVRGVVETGKTRNLVETLASDIAETILGGFPKVQSVDVFVKKPQVALMGDLKYAGVRIRRTRA